jgi:hypothetical protein
MQTRNLSHAAFVAIAVISTAVLAAPGGGGKPDSQTCLVRPDDGPDGNAKGTLRIRSQGNAERFDVHIMKVEGGTDHHLWIEDPLDSDLFTDLGDLPGGGGSQKLALNTKHGDDLPLGVQTVEELIGRKVQIRKGADIELVGEVPPFGLSKKPVKVKQSIDAEDTAPQPKIEATLELRSKADKGQERIILTLKHVDFSDGPFHVVVEDGVGSGIFVDAGHLEQLTDSKGRYRRDCKQGQMLPGGVMFVTDLAGRRLEVRDDADVVYLSTTIPDAN